MNRGISLCHFARKLTAIVVLQRDTGQSTTVSVLNLKW
jgi:hypothetical protein